MEKNNSFWAWAIPEWIYPEATIADGKPEANKDEARGTSQSLLEHPACLFKKYEI